MGQLNIKCCNVNCEVETGVWKMTAAGKEIRLESREGKYVQRQRLRKFFEE